MLMGNITLLSGSGTIPVAVPLAPFTRPRELRMLASIMQGILGVYRKMPWDGTP
jgi:hypothetical protein